MSKGGTFFLRQQMTATIDEAWVQEELDIGAYVNLGSTKPQVLRVHSVQIQFSDSTGLVPTIKPADSTGDWKGAYCNAAITTKARSSANYIPVLGDDETMFTAGLVGANGNPDAGGDQGIYSDAMDIAPQHLVNGYLVGVDTLHFYARADDAWAENITVSFLLECSVEPATRENAINLALSQS
jgi:hypothetical protein